MPLGQGLVGGVRGGCQQRLDDAGEAADLRRAARLAARSNAFRATQGLPPLALRSTDPQTAAAKAAAATRAELNETVHAAHERGEKLSQLDEQSAALAD